MDHQRAIQNLAAECYLLDEMTPGEREAFEEHFFECPTCASDVREALQFIADARDVLEPAPVSADPVRSVVVHPQRGQSTRKWLGWLQPQFAGAAIALLAVVCVVETVAIPGLRRRLDEAVAPRVVGSAYLKPQTRGTPAILKAGAGQPMIIMFDPPESTARVFQVAVESADGRVEFQLSSEAPPTGEPVTLSIPKLDLQPGSYMLIVKAPAATGQDGQELGRYPFELQRP